MVLISNEMCAGVSTKFYPSVGFVLSVDHSHLKRTDDIGLCWARLIRGREVPFKIMSYSPKQRLTDGHYDHKITECVSEI